MPKQNFPKIRFLVLAFCVLRTSLGEEFPRVDSKFHPGTRIPSQCIRLIRFRDEGFDFFRVSCADHSVLRLAASAVLSRDSKLQSNAALIGSRLLFVLLRLHGSAVKNIRGPSSTQVPSGKCAQAGSSLSRIVLQSTDMSPIVLLRSRSSKNLTR